jgi:hypothetical protein
MNSCQRRGSTVLSPAAAYRRRPLIWRGARVVEMRTVAFAPKLRTTVRPGSHDGGEEGGAMTSLDADSPHPAIAAALRDLDSAGQLPLEARAAALESVHQRLAEVLDGSPSPPVAPAAEG